MTTSNKSAVENGRNLVQERMAQRLAIVLQCALLASFGRPLVAAQTNFEEKMLVDGYGCETLSDSSVATLYTGFFLFGVLLGNAELYKAQAGTGEKITQFTAIDGNRLGDFAILAPDQGSNHLCLVSSGSIRILTGTGLNGGAGIGTFSGIDQPAINDSNVVAFHATTATKNGIYQASISNGLPVVKAIAQTGDPSPDGGTFASFNSNVLIGKTADGKPLVAFNAATTAAGGGGLFLGTTTISSLVVTGSHSDMKVNSSGQVVFAANGIELGTVGGAQTVVAIGDPAPNGGTFSSLSNPMVNDAGQIAFLGSTANPFFNGVYLWSQGNIVTIAETGPARGGGTYESFTAPLINNHGLVAFQANVTETNAGGEGIFLGNGTDTLRVVVPGDVVFGSIVSREDFGNFNGYYSVGTPGHSVFNERGQIIFDLSFPNDRGVCLYTPGCHWRGSAAGDWDNSDNWTFGAAPSTSGHVIIDPDSPVTVTGPEKATVETLQVGGGAGAANLVLPQGTLLTSKGAVILPGNSLTIAGSMSGNLECAGALSTGDAPATAKVHGSLKLDAYSSVTIKLAGVDAGAQYDSLEVSGSIGLNGVLNVSLLNGFQPQPGDEFTILHSASKSGQFITVNLPTLQTGLTWVTKNLRKNGSISVSGNDYFKDYEGAYIGLINAASPTSLDSGLIKITLEPDGSFTVASVLGGVSYNWHGFLNTSGGYHFSGTSGKAGPLGKTGDSLDLQLDMTNQTGTISGGISDSAGMIASFAVPLTLSGYSKKNPAPLTGKYTLILPPDGTQTEANYPQGTGYATLNVAPTGLVQLTGILGDGTAMSMGGVLSQGNALPVYVPLYGKKGSISGLLTIDLTNASPISGTLNWFKSSIKSGLYASGFSGVTAAAGSAYVPPPTQPQIFPSGAATLSISGGGVSVNPADKPLQIGTDNKVTIADSERFKMSFSAKSGFFSGTFTDTNGKAWKFNGAVLQTQGMGGGLFKGIEQIGGVELDSN